MVKNICFVLSGIKNVKSFIGIITLKTTGEEQKPMFGAHWPLRKTKLQTWGCTG